MSSQERVQAKGHFGAKMLLFMAPLWIASVLFAWISVIASTNVLIGSNVYLVSAIDLVSSLIDVCVYAVAFAFLAVAATAGSKLAVSCIIFTVGSALRYFVSAVISGIVLGSVSVSDLISACVALILDVVIMGIVLVITVFVKKRSATKDPSPKQRKCPLMPDFSNVLDKCIFTAGVIWAAIKLLSLLAYDISYVIFIGRLTFGNVIWMVIYYLCAILICPVFYLIAAWTVKRIKLN